MYSSVSPSEFQIFASNVWNAVTAKDDRDAYKVFKISGVKTSRAMLTFSVKLVLRHCACVQDSATCMFISVSFSERQKQTTKTKQNEAKQSKPKQSKTKTIWELWLQATNNTPICQVLLRFLLKTLNRVENQCTSWSGDHFSGSGPMV